MVRRIILILVLVFILFFACVSSLDWAKTDFEAYAASDPSLKEFAFKYFGHEVNLKLGICCTDYMESEFTIDVLPVREIADYMEGKYGVVIDTSEFEAHRKNGHFDLDVIQTDDGDELIEHYDDFIKIDGLTLVGTLFTHGSWATVSWSETPEIESIFKYEEGHSNQMQIHIATNPIGSWIKIWLRIKSDTPNRDGYYDMTIVAEERVNFDFKTNGCNLEEIKAAIQQIPDMLRQQDQQ